MDEYVGILRNHPESYHSFMFNKFFKHIDIESKHVHILNGEAPDLLAECKRYENDIKAEGGIELFLAGLGPDGHIAFNEPGSSLTSRTRIKSLAYETVVANARFFNNDITAVPHTALTVGVGTVMDAREIVLLASGMHKAHALAKCVEEGVNHMYTMSALQMHPNALIVCDEDATMEFRVRTVKYFKGLEKTAQSF
uniref:Glucosamine-6-phosphate isomerase n=1 Tax=Lygus hesperus TaxID=30085 RepID=A0A0A9Y984_LYGHE